MRCLPGRCSYCPCAEQPALQLMRAHVMLFVANDQFCSLASCITTWAWASGMADGIGVDARVVDVAGVCGMATSRTQAESHAGWRFLGCRCAVWHVYCACL